MAFAFSLICCPHRRQSILRWHSAPTPAGLPNTSLCFAFAAWISLSTAADYRPVSCSLVARFLSCKQRPSCAIEGTLPNGISWFAPTVNHCSAHGIWNHASDRCLTTHHCLNGLLPLPVAPSQVQKWLDQDKFLSALPWPSAGPYASEALPEETGSNR